MLVMLNILSQFDLTKFAPSASSVSIWRRKPRIAYMIASSMWAIQHVNVDVARILARESPTSTSAR